MDSFLFEGDKKPNIWAYTVMLHCNAVSDAERAYWKGFYQGLKWLLREQPVFIAIPDNVAASIKNAEVNGFWASIHAINPTYIDSEAGNDPYRREQFFRNQPTEAAI